MRAARGPASQQLPGAGGTAAVTQAVQTCTDMRHSLSLSSNEHPRPQCHYYLGLIIIVPTWYCTVSASLAEQHGHAMVFTQQDRAQAAAMVARHWCLDRQSAASHGTPATSPPPPAAPWPPSQRPSIPPSAHLLAGCPQRLLRSRQAARELCAHALRSRCTRLGDLPVQHKEGREVQQ